VSNGILGHAYFEELCALASVGEILPSEYQELSDHLRACATCRDSYQEFSRLTHVQLPLEAAEHSPVPELAGIGQVLGRKYKARFAARARELGLEISGPEMAKRGLWAHSPVFSVPRLSYQHAAAVVILTLLALAGVASHLWREASIRSAAFSAQVSKLSELNATLQRQVETLSQGKQSVETDLVRTRTSSSDLTLQLRALEQQVRDDKLMLQNLNAQLIVSNAHGTQAEEELQETQQRLLGVNQEIAQLRASGANDATKAASQQVEMAELSRRVKEQEEVIEKQQRLLSVDTDVRNLMAARSLHITDVFDVDGKGKKKSAFGRVFYTEGKSLIFYAFDLPVPRDLNANRSFQAWGQLTDSSISAVNLGVFYVDDPSQRRWMLKFDNPEVLKQLNAVFVTVEPHGGTTRPTGQKLMYAYLGHEPNHP
jgi:hypothetical protein